MDKKYIVFGAPAFEQQDIDEVTNTIASGWVGTGPKVQKFEHLFADYIKADKEHVVAVNSCTAALHLSLMLGHEAIAPMINKLATITNIINGGSAGVC